MKKANSRTLRNNRGLSIILLVIVLAIVQIAIYFFVFNFVRILMIQRQITGVCEAASLAGTSILSKIDVSNDDVNHKKLKNAQQAACRCAENMVLRGHILGSTISKPTRIDDLAILGKNLQQESCQYLVTVADPDSNYASLKFGDPKGKTISCYMAFGYKPIFMGFLGNVCYPITANCVSGLPQIDSVLVLDLSASMDDQTAVTFVRREWIHTTLGMGNFAMGNISPANFNSGPAGIIQYVSLQCPSNPHTLANYLGWNPDIGTANDDNEIIDGSIVNVLPPQNLDKANSEPHGAITHPMYFDAYLRSHYSHYDRNSNFLIWEATASPFSRALDYGTPPGNCDLSVGLGGNGDAATDMYGNVATPLGPGAAYFANQNRSPKSGSAPYQPPVNTVATTPTPQLNAFGDLTWQNDASTYKGYQPAAPGALKGMALNDPIPSPDQQTFTDLVVNIVNPSTISGSRTASGANSQSISGPSSDQIISGPDYFMGFSYTFPFDDPDPLLRGQNFDFPNIAVVVEAARGNLENTPVLANGLKNAQAALIDRPVSVDGTIFDMRSIELKDGYQRAYQRLAMLVTQPLGSVLLAIDQGYFQKMHKFADCRFGLVAFSSAGSLSSGGGAEHRSTFGTANDSSATFPNQRSFYIFCPTDGNPALGNPIYDCGLLTGGCLNDTTITDGSGSGFRIPRVALDFSAENYMECVSKNKLKQQSASGETTNALLNVGAGSNGIYNCRPQSLTDSGEALQTAHDMFHSGTYNLGSAEKSRPSANKLIIFFTDGEPTGGLNSKEAQIMLQVAGQGNGDRFGNTCEADGIAIATVSLNLGREKTYNKRKEHQLALLGDNPPAAGHSGGIAWRAGHGGKYYPCESPAELKTAFSDITRHLSQSQR
jgi:hypothetical protein